MDASERAHHAMPKMMGMARRMDNGDAVLGMDRMMEMMGSMGGGGMTGGSPRRQATPKKAQ